MRRREDGDLMFAGRASKMGERCCGLISLLGVVDLTLGWCPLIGCSLVGGFISGLSRGVDLKASSCLVVDYQRGISRNSTSLMGGMSRS